MTNLLPCPFCGKPASDNIANTGTCWVCCSACDAEGPLAPDETSAIEKWNQRVTQHGHAAQAGQHSSDCAVHNAPALPIGPCNCGAELAQPRASASKAGDRTAWLIEVDDDEGPIYFQLVDDDNWSSDHNAALQFARKQDAEKYIADVGWTRARAVEHMWPEASTVLSTHQSSPTSDAPKPTEQRWEVGKNGWDASDEATREDI